MRILWLADELRAAGLTVVEVDGWRTLGSDNWAPTGGIVHATADGAAQNPVADARDDDAAIRVIRNGRPGLAGPIANAYHSRSGVWWVIASGRCNTALTGTAGPLRGLGNHSLLGIEHENDNRGERWPEIQWRTALLGWAVICRRLRWQAGRLAGHKEHDPGRKSDPLGIDMGAFRAAVARLIPGGQPGTSGGDDDVLTDDQNRKLHNLDRLMLALVNGHDEVTGLVLDKGVAETRPLPLVRDIAELKARPAGTVALSPEDRRHIVGGVLDGLRTVVREEVAARFADAGQVDDPPTG